MRISISNIAWDVTDDLKISQILNRYGINAIDIAPGKYFSNFQNTTIDEIKKISQWWEKRGIEIVGMQSLLFGTLNLNIFGQEDVQKRLNNHLIEVMRIANCLGVKRLVFGSPKNRDRTGLSDDETIKIATEFFRNLGTQAEKYNVLICLEPNPTCYGANFMTTTEETASVVKYIDHKNIKMQIDTGAIAINQEDLKSILIQYHSLVGHIHVSEPNLVPIGDLNTNHKDFGANIRQFFQEEVVTIEMLVNKNESSEVAIERAIKVTMNHYGN
jgi:D-psicose/D-tagatose/L-ribulose 3-epimerase